MRKLMLPLAVGLSLLSGLAASGRAAIKGDYIEVRSADVYTGPCFANSEVGLTGKEAILGWKVQEGSWKGVSLAGLSVVAAVTTQATLGDPYHNPYPAHAVLILDSRASREQRSALAEFARSMAGGLLAHVVRVETAPIEFTVEHGDHHGAAKLVAGQIARIETRSLCQGDIICGNEVVYYPPLVNLAHAMPAFALDESFQGQGLGVVWKLRDKRCAFVGAFTLG
jgi:hypothetical protein